MQRVDHESMDHQSRSSNIVFRSTDVSQICEMPQVLSASSQRPTPKQGMQYMVASRLSKLRFSAAAVQANATAIAASLYLERNRMQFSDEVIRVAVEERAASRSG